MEKAGMKPDVVDVLPTAAANAVRGPKPEGVTAKSTAVIVHVGPEATTLVFDGRGPFFTRSFFFDAALLSGGDPAMESSGEMRERLTAFGQELLRSISYYEKTYRIADMGELWVLGEYVGHPGIRQQIEAIGLHVRYGAPLPEGVGRKARPGVFDLAIGLAAHTAHAKGRETRHRINLVRLIREEEKRLAGHRRKLGLATFAGVVLLGLSLAYSGWQIVHMESVLRREREKLSRIAAEYRQYTETEALIGDADIRLLDDLKNNSIFWTRKLAAVARFLPDGYATTGLTYDGEELSLEGTGSVSPGQRQLMKLYAYMHALRNDSTFNDVFGNVSLSSAKRGGSEDGRELRFSLTARK
jgi:Tfp pilus assembly protein PilN